MADLKKALKYILNVCFATRGRFRLKFAKKSALVILTYHRVLPANHRHREFEQPGMVVTPTNFARHIQALKHFGGKPMMLEDWLEKRLNGDPLPRLSFAVTFDDGWRDNYEYAFPVLKDEKVPATIFLVSALLDTSKVFWPERVLFILTQRNADDFTPEIRKDLAWLEPFTDHYPFAKRQASLEEADRAVTRLKELNDAFIITKLDQAMDQHHTLRPPADPRYILNSPELKELQNSGLVRFGAHTRHHYRLNRLPDTDSLQGEIVDCKSDLVKYAGYPVPLFCYPNGNITEQGEELVKENYLGACTTLTGFNNSSTSPHAFRRFTMHDGNSDTTLKLLASLGKGAA